MSTSSPKPAVQEARAAGATVIALVDTNCDPDGVDYVIPGNDDSLRSIKLITQIVADAILGDDEPFSGPDDFDAGPDLQPSGVPRRPAPIVDEQFDELDEPEEADEEV